MPPDYTQPPLPPALPPQPPAYPPQQPSVHPATYDFILNPTAETKKPLLNLPSSNNSKIVRFGMIAVGLVVLIILFSVIKGLIFKGPTLTGYIGVAQDQQELIHLFTGASNSTNGQSLSNNNQNLAATGEASLTSNQTNLITYLSKNGTKLNAKTLALKVSTSLDTQLTNAQTAGTYDSTYQGIIQTELTSYLSDISSTYKSSSGLKGRALLKSLYAQGNLLLEQAKAPTD